MNYMFNNTAFNQPLNNWNVSNVTSMNYMFAVASAFNQPLNNWNVSNVTSMSVMFAGAFAFNQNISGWNVANVTPKPPSSFRNNSILETVNIPPSFRPVPVITFSLSSKTFGDAPFQLNATSTNTTTPFTYESDNSSVATISNNILTIVGAGTANINANQVVSNDFNSGSKTTTFTVFQATPIITNFLNITKTFGDSSFNLNPLSTSGGSFVYESDPTIATVSETGTVTIIGAGTTSIQLYQAPSADGNYTSTSKTMTLTVNKAPTLISNFSDITKTFSDETFNLTDPTSNRAGSFSYVSSDSTIASISGSTVTIKKIDTVTITVTQSETTNYEAGSATATLTINNGTRTTVISNFYESGITKTYGDSAFDFVNPDSNSPASFTYESANEEVATVSGNTITIVGAGTSQITVKQLAFSNSSVNYGASEATMTLTVNSAST